MSWQQELDELIQTTMRIASNARRDHPTPSTPSHVSPAKKPVLDTLKQVGEPRPTFSPMSERDAIQRRVHNFKAHQQRVAREREDYYLLVKDSILTSLDQRR